MFGLAVVIPVLGCSQDANRTVTENLRRAELQEELRIDGHAEDLVPIGWYAPGDAVAVSPSGAIALAQDQDARIRVFTATGEVLRTIGREGGGPGEFRAITQFGWRGDSLWVYDGRLSRITIFSPQGRVLRTQRTPSQGVPPPDDPRGAPRFPFLSVQNLLPNDRLLAGMQLATLQDAADAFENRTTYARITLDGVIERIVARIPIGRVQVNLPDGSAYILPFPNASIEDTSPDGGLIAFAFAELEGANAGTFFAASFDAAGDTLFARRYPFQAVEIPGRVRDSIVAELHRDMPIPPIYPPLECLLVGRDSTVWIEMIVRENGWRPYLVLEPDGEVLGTAHVPANTKIAAAQRSRIWAIERDELDVESLVRYRVTWQAAMDPDSSSSP